MTAIARARQLAAAETDLLGQIRQVQGGKWEDVLGK